MSQSDSFIDEVSEEVRRDRLFAAFRRYGWIGAVIVVVLVGGAAWNEYRKAQNLAAAQQFGDGLLAALEEEAPQERVTALDTITAPGPVGDALRRMLQASEAATAGDTENAVALLSQVAASAETPPIYRALAEFRALVLQSDSLTPAERRTGFEAMTAPGAPLRVLAQEQIALTYIEEGDREAALALLWELQQEAEASAGLRQRTSQLIVTLGGDRTATEDAGEPGAETSDAPAD
ncbi:tetratricopeptide repeat protein [Pseudooceanicola sp. C21-150M6]|uniref:tetratricopeptide repeat protein n=1 Tax=Pseudooceanicola sp. C21-150M6 TaxID=3434355 RepID=UPI003D7F7433